MSQIHEIAKRQGGFLVLRYQDKIFGSDGLHSMCSTALKPFDHILLARGKIDVVKLLKNAIFIHFSFPFQGETRNADNSVHSPYMCRI